MAELVKTRRWSFAQISFVILMIALTGLFVVLGNWQAGRLAEKEALIATVEARIHDAPNVFPAADLWADIDPLDFDYRPYALTGTYDHDETVLVFDNLPDAIGRYGGVGYWVMAPFHIDQGGVVWVNRGFVPEALADDYVNGGDGPLGEVTLEAVARRPERSNAFTPASDIADRREWVRDPVRLTAFLPDLDTIVAPVTLDRVAGQAGELPQGGETQVTFSNRHLEYAGTWYSFAAITPIMLGFWLWRQRRPSHLAPEEKGN